MKSTRRRFIQQLTGLGLAGSGGLSTQGFAKTKPADITNAQTAFSSSFLNVPEQFEPVSVKFDHALPSNLKGTLYRNGPAKMVRGNTRMRHWFDGDGMINALRFDTDQIHHHGKMVMTSRFTAERDAGRYLWNGFGTSFNDARPVATPDTMNPGNISVLPVDDQLLALWEAGSPWRIDPRTLETQGRHVFSEETDGLPFSAHPRIDPNGRIWNFGYLSGSGKLVLYDISKSGNLNRVALVDEPESNMVHDFAVTERHLVFILMPFSMDLSNNAGTRAFMERLQWKNDAPVIALVINKENLRVVRRFEIPPFFAFHFGNAWQDGESIHIQTAQAPAFHSLMKTIVQASTGEALTADIAEPPAIELTLDLRTGTSRTTKLPVSGADFPRFDQRFTGIRTADLFMLGRSASASDQTFGFNTVVHVDARTEAVQTFDYGENMLAEEHVFVGNSARQGDGWLVGTAFDWQAHKTVISVFNARHVQDGPISQAVLPYGLPLGLHGQFVPA